MESGVNIVLRGPEKEMATLRWDNQNLVGAVFPLLNPLAHSGYQRAMPLKLTEDGDLPPEVPQSQSQTQEEIELLNMEDSCGQVIQDPIFDGIFLITSTCGCSICVLQKYYFTI